MTLTTVDAGMLNSQSQQTWRNRIINGAMVIDQRNAGASVTPTADAYLLDRWRFQTSQSSKLSFQQNAGSVTPPAGFTNYLGATSLSAFSIGSSDLFVLGQAIEGFNAADLAWGTASAQAVTISFWVRSSLTGTFGGALRNSANNRSYPFTYTVSAANTFEQKTVTIAGDTSGTWVTNNGIGIRVFFGLGVGSTVSGTAGAWSGNEFWGATGATSVVGTNGATFYITGVQLEKGSTATSFDYRPYGTELALCQRYFEKSYEVTTAPGTNTGTGAINNYGSSDGTNNQVTTRPFAVTKRTSPTMTFYTMGGTAGSWEYYRSGGNGTAAMTNYFAGTTSWAGYLSVGASWVACYMYGQWTASAEL